MSSLDAVAPKGVQRVYRLRNADGLYSQGGTSPRWTRRGKVWHNIGHLKNHIHMWRSIHLRGKYNYNTGRYAPFKGEDPTLTWTVEVVELTPVTTDEIPVAQLFEERKEDART